MNDFIYELANECLEEDEYVCIDEGYFLKLSTIFVQIDLLINKDFLESIIFIYGKPELVIYLQKSIQTSYRHMKERSKGLPKRISLYSQDSQIKHLENIDLLQKHILLLSSQHNIKIKYLNTYQ